MFAGVHGRDEAFGVQMLRGGDEDGVERRIVEQSAGNRRTSSRRARASGVVEAAGVDIGERREFDVGTGDGFARELRAAVANADDADAEAVVRAENAAGRETAGQARGHVADEVSSGLHGSHSV